MDKGTRVRVVKGRKHQGVVGTVFWEGPDKYNEGETRLGVKSDGGETVWVRTVYCEALKAGDEGFEAPEPDLPDKGDRVRWSKGEEIGYGTVFWVGESKAGALRVGVSDEETEEALWFDAGQVGPADEIAAEDADDEVPF